MQSSATVLLFSMRSRQAGAGWILWPGLVAAAIRRGCVLLVSGCGRRCLYSKVRGGVREGP